MPCHASISLPTLTVRVFIFSSSCCFLNFWFVIVARVVFCLCYDNLCLAGNWAAIGHGHRDTPPTHTGRAYAWNGFPEPAHLGVSQASKCKWKSLRKQKLKQQQKFIPAMNEWSLSHSSNNIVLSRTENCCSHSLSFFFPPSIIAPLPSNRKQFTLLFLQNFFACFYLFSFNIFMYT